MALTTDGEVDINISKNKRKGSLRIITYTPMYKENDLQKFVASQIKSVGKDIEEIK